MEQLDSIDVVDETTQSRKSTMNNKSAASKSSIKLSPPPAGASSKSYKASNSKHVDSTPPSHSQSKHKAATQREQQQQQHSSSITNRFMFTVRYLQVHLSHRTENQAELLQHSTRQQAHEYFDCYSLAIRLCGQFEYKQPLYACSVVVTDVFIDAKRAPSCGGLPKSCNLVHADSNELAFDSAKESLNNIFHLERISST